MDANLIAKTLKFLGPDHQDGGGTSSVLIHDDQNFLKQFNLNFSYPYFLSVVYENEKRKLHEILEEYLQTCLDLEYEYLVRSITLANCLYTIAIDLKEQIVYFYSQRLSDELFLYEALQEGHEKESLGRFNRAIQKVDLLETPPEISVLRKRYGLQKYDSIEILNDLSYQKVSVKELDLKKNLVEKIDSYRSSFFEKVSDFFLVLTSEYDLIRIHLLKFLAVLPCLDHDKEGSEVKRIFLESLRRFLSDNKRAKRKEFRSKVKVLPAHYLFVLQLAYLISSLVPAFFLSFILRQSTRYMAKRFIAGEDIRTSKKVLLNLDQTGRNATVDQLGELVLTEEEADLYKERVLEVIRGMKDIFTRGERNKVGILKAHVSIKVSALASDFIPEAFEHSYNQIAPRLKEILHAAKNEKVFINIDAEHYHYRDIVWEIYKKVLEEDEELYKWEDTGIVIQAYLKDAFEHYNEIQFFSQKRKILMPVRLVKGAYWDAETVEADAHSDSPPQFINKVETDIHFRQLIFEILKQPFLQLCLASHNLSDHCFAQALREKQIPAAHPIEHQCLHMTYEALSRGLEKLGFTVRNYVPVGDLIVGMAYLVRRIMENSSQVGILAMMRSHRDQLKNIDLAQKLNRKIQERRYLFEKNFSTQSENFFNNAPIKTYLSKRRKEYEMSGEQLIASFGERTNNNFDIYSPSNRKLLLGSIKHYTASDAKKIIDTASDCFLRDDWSTRFDIRARVLIKANHYLKYKRDTLSNLIVHESGKTHKEAIADVDEAIDFISFYLREELRFLETSINAKAKGVFLVIAPWNFPLAIPCGMTVASLIAGNSVCLKSAEQSPLIAEMMVEIFHRAGVPRGILQHIPGEGSDVGQALGEDERVAGVVFTGSKEVGCHLFKQHSLKQYTHPQLMRPYQRTMIAEMGGKNAIIVTNNAELDETVDGVLYSAFAHSGQKCSAASRVLVHKSIKKNFLDRFLKATKVKKVGAASLWETSINPIITKEDRNRILDTRNRIKEESKLFGGKIHLDRVEEGDKETNCVGPLIVELPTERGFDKESEAQKEHFAPIIHIIEFETLDQAIELLNSTDFALTAGIYSQSQDEIDQFLIKAKAGNLYVNRPNTGARVAIEPFGGFKYSGTGPKAGGRRYLRELHVNDESFEKIETVISKNGSNYYQTALKNHESESQRLQNILSREMIDRDFYNMLFKVLENGYQSPNRFIEGQLSYTLTDVSEKKVLIILSQEEISLKISRWINSSYLFGLPTTIICTNQKVYAEASSHYASLQSIEILFGNFELLESFAFKTFFERVILDGDEDFRERCFKQINLFGERSLTKVFSNISGNIYDEEDYIRFLSEPKSVALNTMRHGAPLNLS